MRAIFRLCVKSTVLLARAAAAAQDTAGFTDFALDLEDEEGGDDTLPLAFLMLLDAEVGLLMDVFEVFKADTTVVFDDDVDVDIDVQCTGGFGKAVGAGAS